jgi:hypothetical protein
MTKDLENAAVTIDNSPLVDPDDRVMTLAEFDTSVGISAATRRRLVAAGKGPTITNLSDHRKGVTVKNRRRWLAQRSGNPPNAV